MGASVISFPMKSEMYWRRGVRFSKNNNTMMELIKEVLPVGDYHLQEERRLFYVGMTRAKEQLFFTAADYYGEGKREKKLSKRA